MPTPRRRKDAHKPTAATAVGTATPAGSNSSPRRAAVQERLALAVIVGVAAVLLFWRLGAVYLWQDEANTAVLAVRMLHFGKPLAYDGKNLLTNDNFAAEDPSTISTRTTSASREVDYIVDRGDLKADTSWIYQPWGQFIVAAASIKLLGQTTLAPRVPFALAALGTVVACFRLVRRASGNVRMALVATALLVANASWVLHGRQARYYALSSLGLVVTLLAYERWQRRAPWGAVVFAASAWMWFQVDYGTVWPVLGVLFGHAVLVSRRREPILTGLALAAAIAPFVYYYQLWGRQSSQLRTWGDRFMANALNLDLYVLPAVVLLAAALLLRARWRQIAAPERRVVGLSVAILVALSVWIPSVAPAPYVRYIIMTAPIGCLVTAWVLVRAFKQPLVVWGSAAVLAAVPWLTIPVNAVVPESLHVENTLVRDEWPYALREIFGSRADPNRIVIEWLRQHSAPTDQILVNYEDAPLIYYLPNPIRGGVAAFRAEDDTNGPPQFALMRRSVSFVHWPVFIRELGRYQWDQIEIGAPDVIWGNNPDPSGRPRNSASPTTFVVGRRRD